MTDKRQGSVFDWNWAEQTPAARAGYARQLALDLSPYIKVGDRVLDLGCGAGAIAIECAARGANVTAIDGAASLLELARRESSRRELSVDWVHGDILGRDFGEGIYRTALCIGNVILDIPHPRFPAFAESVARALLPGGFFVIEYQDGVLRCAGLEERGKEVLQTEPEHILRRFKAYDLADGSWTDEYENLTRGERLDYTAYLYTRPLLEAILQHRFERVDSRQVGARNFLDCYRCL